MDVNFDYVSRKMLIGDKAYSLDKLEEFILQKWHPLAKRFFIKAITVKAGLRLTFDWAKIFSLAAEGGIIIEEFLDSQDVFQRPPGKPLKQISMF